MSDSGATYKATRAPATAAHAADASEPALGEPSAAGLRFRGDGPIPPVANSGDENKHPPSASELAYGSLEEVLDRTSSFVTGANVDAMAELIERHPQLSAPLVAVIEHTHGEPVARAVATTTRGERSTEPRARQVPPTRVADAPMPVERRRKIAAFEQIARSHIHEAGAAQVLEIPAALVEALERAWRDADAKQEETGGNVVRTYGGKYKLRRGGSGTSGTFESDEQDVGLGEAKIGTAHTHPYRKEGYTHGTFSPTDIVNIVDENEPLKFLRSGPFTYMIAHTKEFDELVARHEKEQRLDQLKQAMMKSYLGAFDAASGKFPDQLEAGVIAVCKQFHLVYYEGKGNEIHRVGAPSSK